MEEIYNWLERIVNFVHHTGYLGIFLMTMIESSFLPIPAEITMIPAGYLVYQEKLSFPLVIFSSITGTIFGASINYYIAYNFGRKVLIKYGKYFLITEKKLIKIEEFFYKHGAISTFIGRLIPGVRHFISFPAGLAKMNITKFILYTGLGGGIWMLTLTAIGYYIGENEEEISKWLSIITIVILAVCALLVGIYMKKQMKKNKYE